MAGYYDEITGEYIDDGSDYGYSVLDDTSGTDDMSGWAYNNGVWTDPSGGVYDMRYLQDSSFDVGKMLSNLGESAAKKLVSAFTDDKGNVNWRNVASAAGGLYGLYQASQGQDKTGFQGKIPTYEAQRTRLDLPQDPERRPGEYGRRYFSDVVFAAPTPAAEAAPVEQPAEQVVEQTADQSTGMAAGGLAGLAKGRYLRGQTDGMADKIPARIGGKQEAALSHGEFVIPADVVGHLGNGNSDAGAQRLYEMMDRIRKARTGTTKQGKRVNPNKFLPS
jgi:hypothetical protein